MSILSPFQRLSWPFSSLSLKNFFICMQMHMKPPLQKLQIKSKQHVVITYNISNKHANVLHFLYWKLKRYFIGCCAPNNEKHEKCPFFIALPLYWDYPKFDSTRYLQSGIKIWNVTNYLDNYTMYNFKKQRVFTARFLKIFRFSHYQDF